MEIKDLTICVLMCGGIGSRIITNSKISKRAIEKPLIILKNKHLIEYIIDTLINSKKGFKIIAAVSSNTKQTEDFIKDKYCNKITVLRTNGKGYSKDFTSVVNYIINEFPSGELEKQDLHNNMFMANEKPSIDYSKIIFLPIDLPLISTNTIEKIAEIKQKTPLISIVIDKKIVIERNFLPTPYTVHIDKKDYCHTGISVLGLASFKNLNKDLPGNQIEEENIIFNDPEFAYNINTIDDLKRTEEFLDKNMRTEETKNRSI
jgi:GTP:adenosylcobinamide-phosphate guanylyltransferase